MVWRDLGGSQTSAPDLGGTQSALAGGGAAAYILTGSLGTYNFTGIDSSLKKYSLLPMFVGSYSLSGNSSNLLYNKLLVGNTGYYTVNFLTGSLTETNINTLNIRASRLSGVAPLVVFFDATSNTIPGEDRPFHHAQYTWDFDDPTSLFPTAGGALSSHVFGTSGNYAVRCNITTTGGFNDYAEQNINVLDPEIVFSGTGTICVSTDGSFTDAPAGCTQVTTSSFDTAMTYASAGKRVLLKRGQTFTATAPATVNITGGPPAYIGAFGSGSSPDTRGIYANNPIISSQVAIETNTLPIRGNDLRICDLSFMEGAVSAESAGVIGADYRCDNVLLHRCYTSGFWSSVSFSQDLINFYGSNPHSGCSISQCHFESGRITTTYIGGIEMSIIGTHYDANILSHLCRVTFMNKGVIQGNLLENPGPTRHALKLHANQNRTLYGDYSQNIVISENIFKGDDNAWLVAIAPQDASPNDDERIRDVLVERNRIIAEHGVQVAYYTDCVDSTFRNNVIVRPDYVTITSNLWGWWVVQRGAASPVPSGLEIMHNTMHDDSAGASEQVLLFVDNYTGNPIKLWNNCISTTGTTNFITYPGQSSFSDSQGNITSNSATITFSDPSIYDFHPSTGSALLGAAVDAPVLIDFLGNTRNNNDVGAYERSTSSIITASIGSFVLNGQSSNLLKSSILYCNIGSFIINSSDNIMSYGRNLISDIGNYTTNYTNSTLLKDSLIEAANAQYDVNFIDSALRKSIIITSNSVQYLLNVSNSNLLKDSILGTTPVQYDTNSPDSLLKKDSLMASSYGEYSTTIAIATLLKSNLMQAIVAQCSVNSSSAGLLKKYLLIDNQSNYTIESNNSSEYWDRFLDLAGATYTLSGPDIIFYNNRIVSFLQGDYTVDGGDATLTANLIGAYTLAGDYGIFNITMNPSNLFYNRLITSYTNSYLLESNNSNLFRDRILNSISASYILAVSNASLRYNSNNGLRLKYILSFIQD